MIPRLASQKSEDIILGIEPKMVVDVTGQVTEVILKYKDYQRFLHFVAYNVDWETLPPYLQDAVDHYLAEEAREEQGDELPTPLEQVLQELGMEIGEACGDAV